MALSIPWRRIAELVLPSLAGGLLMALSLPPFGFWPLAFAGGAVLWWRIGAYRTRGRFAAGWLFGVGLYGVGLWWITDFNVYGGLLVIVLESLAPAIAAALAPKARGRTPALAGAMVLTEMARSTWPLGGLPLGGVALGQAGGPLADVARLGGPLLIVGLVWLGAGGIGAAAEMATRRSWYQWLARREPAGWRQLTGQAAPAEVRTLPDVGVIGAVASVLVALSVVAAVGAAGSAAADGGPARSHVVVSAVQGGGQRGLSKRDVDPSTVLAAQVRATNALLSRPGPRPGLVVWPEDVVALNGPLAGSAAESALSSLARQGHSTLLAGVTEPVGTSRFRNEIVAFSPAGRVVARFEKVHRVPFGEYIPWRGFIEHLADVSAVPLDAVPGHADGLLRTPAGPLGAMVSYEVFFPDRGRGATRAGAELLVVPTNTSSYSTAQVPTQEVAADRLQAISEGRDLVQSAPTGFSDLVDHDGRVLARSSLGSAALVTGTLALRVGHTVYERLGDALVLVLAALAVLGGWLAALGSPTESARRMRGRSNPRYPEERSYTP